LKCKNERALGNIFSSIVIVKKAIGVIEDLVLIVQNQLVEGAEIALTCQLQ